jgi:PAS domain S-box-containing protein
LRRQAAGLKQFHASWSDMALKLLLIKVDGLPMKTTNHHGRKVVSLINIGPQVSNGKQAGTGRRQAHDGLEQRVAELEQQVAGLSARNAELVRVNKDLADARRQLRALLDNVPDRIYFKDTQSRFIQCNRAVARRVGVEDPEQVISKTDFDFYPREKAEEFRKDDQRIMQSGEPLLNKTEQVIKPNGEITWSSVTKVPLRDKEGKVAGLVGISRDITEQKQAEEALRRSNETLAQERLLLRTLIDNLPDGIYAKDTSGRKTMANPADLKVMGCKTEANAIGKSDFDFFPKDIAEKFWADDQMVIAGQPVIKREEFFIDEKGRKRWLLTSKLPLRDQGGTIVGLVGIGRDITQQKQSEDALRRSDEKLRQFAAQLERSNRELQDFAYVASHDLQEPLRKVVVFGERLKDKNADKFGPESLDYLDRMQKATGRMQTLINDLLSFSRVTTKAQPFTPVNLAEVAAAVVDDLEGRIELVKGRVEVGPLPVIEAEPLQMRQLLQNLIGNALKFRRPEEPPVVKVETQIITDPDTPEKKLCRLTVSDNGIGFDEKYLDRIFNVFQRLHTRNEYEGTGMGLAIVKKIALYHGGDVTAKSKPGEGATFILTLPVAHPKKTQDEIKNKEGQTP